MRLNTRLKRIEEKISPKKQIWVVFSIRCYEDPIERNHKEQALIDAYTAQGDKKATHCIFINELPFPRAICEERYVCKFEVNVF